MSNLHFGVGVFEFFDNKEQLLSDEAGGGRVGGQRAQDAAADILHVHRVVTVQDAQQHGQQHALHLPAQQLRHTPVHKQLQG